MIVPGEPHPSGEGNRPPVPTGLGDLELEPYSIGIRPRQAGDGARYYEQSTFQRGRERRVEGAVGTQQRPQESAGDERRRAGGETTPGHECAQGQESHVQGIGDSRQVRKQRDARGKQRDPCAHPYDPRSRV